MEYSERLCDQKHREIDGKIDHHEKWLDEHEKKIDDLSTASTKNATNIENLAKAISGQTKAIWALVITILTVLTGFFVWYIENLPH